MHVLFFSNFVFVYFRSLKAEKERYKQEMEFQIKMMELENQRRTQEREHEMRIVSLIMNGNMQSQNVTHTPIQYHHQWPETFAGFPRNSTYINHWIPLNTSDSSSETSSTTNTEEG